MLEVLNNDYWICYFTFSLSFYLCSHVKPTTQLAKFYWIDPQIHGVILFRTRGPFLESPGNLPRPMSVFDDKCFLTEVNFC